MNTNLRDLNISYALIHALLFIINVILTLRICEYCWRRQVWERGVSPEAHRNKRPGQRVKVATAPPLLYEALQRAALGISVLHATN
jgi:hypothetical protein